MLRPGRHFSIQFRLVVRGRVVARRGINRAIGCYKLRIFDQRGSPSNDSPADPMSDDPNSPKHEKWKKLIHILIHALYLILSLMLFVAALLNVIGGPTASGVLGLIFFGIAIATFLFIVEIIHFCRLENPCKTPGFVKRYLGFLTCVVGRGVFYQMLGFPYMMEGTWRYWSYRSREVGKVSVVFGWIIWGIGFCLMVIAVSAKAYNFADWIEDEEDEGELRLDSDDEDIELLRDQGGLSKL